MEKITGKNNEIIKGVKKLNENKESRIEKTGFWVHFGGGMN